MSGNDWHPRALAGELEACVEGLIAGANLSLPRGARRVPKSSWAVRLSALLGGPFIERFGNAITMIGQFTLLIAPTSYGTSTTKSA